MPDSRPPAGWLLTPLVAFGSTLVGAALLFFAQAELVPALLGGYDAICDAPDCGLGLGLMLMATGFIALCVSLIAGVVVGARFRHDPDVPAAVRRGVLVCLWCLLAYVAASLFVWAAV